jgi:hypothetical protein
VPFNPDNLVSVDSCTTKTKRCPAAVLSFAPYHSCTLSLYSSRDDCWVDYFSNGNYSGLKFNHDSGNCSRAALKFEAGLNGYNKDRE